MKNMKKYFKKLNIAFEVIFWNVFGLFPIDKKKVVISNFHGKGFGDSPKYVAIELHKLDPSYKIICLCNKEFDPSTIPSFIKAININGHLSIYHQATAKFWIDNCRKTIAKKRNNQIYIQTWHGFALKKIESDVPESIIGTAYVRSAKRDSRMIDWIISCSSHMSKIYRNSFWYNGKILEYGSPRNDLLIRNDKDTREKVRKHFNISNEQNIVLYAPTFRDDSSIDAYIRDYDMLAQSFSVKFGAQFVFLIKLHPHATKLASSINYNRYVVNASNYADTQELLSAADILITDYSSVMFDFALTYKPCFLYASDLVSYTSSRDFYFDIQHLPFSVSKTLDELNEKISGFDEFNYRKNIDSFFKQVGMMRDGNASNKVAKLIHDI